MKACLYCEEPTEEEELTEDGFCYRCSNADAPNLVVSEDSVDKIHALVGMLNAKPTRPN